MKVHLEFFKIALLQISLEKMFVVVFILYITAISKITFAVLFSLPFSVYFVSNIGVLYVRR